MAEKNSYILSFEEIGSKDVHKVGGKNASLGEMINNLKSEGVRVPTGFATTADAFWEFLEANGLPEKIERRLKDFNQGDKSLEQTGKAIRRLFGKAAFPEGISLAVRNAYQKLCERYGVEDVDVA
ncbi:MAG: PEP/pyruvate-binding domain-containing protein, partial [Deltaproteobacteria bacterium]